MIHLKTLVLFFSCRMVNAAADQQIGLRSLIPPGDRNLRADGLSEDCINGTVNLNLNETVIDALTPFYVNFIDIINDPKDTSECDMDFKDNKFSFSCSFDFSGMIEEHAIAKRACEGTGGKIFLLNLDFAENGNFLVIPFSLSLNVTKFPLCVDEDCDIDGIAIREEENRNADTNNESQARVTPTCVQDGDAIFLRKLKTNKKGKEKAATKTCNWLAGKSNKVKERFCNKKKAFRGTEPARNACFETCCAYRK